MTNALQNEVAFKTVQRGRAFTMFHDAKDRLREISDRSVEYSRENPWIVAGVGISVLVGGLLVSGSKKEYRQRPGTGALSGGGIKRDNVKKAYSDYHDSYGQGAGEGITDRTKTTGAPLLLNLLLMTGRVGGSTGLRCTVRSQPDPA